MGCATDPVADYLGGFGLPIRGAILNAPHNLGDTSRYAGDPAGAAMAAAQLEFLGRSVPTDPIYGPQFSPTLQPGLDAAVAEMRAAVGMGTRADSAAAEARLRQVALSLRGGQPALAQQALADRAIFPLGAEATLARLANLPRLRRVSIAAGELAAELDRLDRSRR